MIFMVFLVGRVGCFYVSVSLTLKIGFYSAVSNYNKDLIRDINDIFEMC